MRARERLSRLAPFITHVVIFMSGAQPRPQGFSLKKWVGKALGTRLVWGVELDILRNKIDSSSLNVRRLIQTLSSQNKL